MTVDYVLECTIHYFYNDECYKINLTKSNDKDKTQTWQLFKSVTRYNDSDSSDWISLNDEPLFHKLLDMVDD